ncbi:class I SAM-dependent methyltransferase [Emticicia sp. 21SJ11W-3]|uniref:class I SAM-dependent methyltransferase n=1 Tax=Emticicia sp. 21SJ11W-3 TaxID=2916755 RepID=UPI00209D36EA|nr:class I SAM-dependent methyltransferase [Emticicia sp. 21SJ11W-3]UTA68506.1 class I SAM-dependent methyltransferase [Emticicia sp. 21SJ11W-3]
MTNYANEGVMALIRYKEFLRNDSLYKDFSAELFFSNESTTILNNLNEKLPYFENLISVRHKLFLDEINIWLKKKEASQIVSLGSGYCTCILDFILNYSISGFEVDKEEVLITKKKILGSKYLPICIPFDFNDFSQDLIKYLQLNGFNISKCSIIFMEGLLYYLEDDAISYLFSSILNFLKETKSILIFDMQVGESKLTDIQKEETNRYNIKNNYKNFSYWMEMINNSGLFLAKFSNIGAVDIWNRLEDNWELITSSFFVVSYKEV